MPRITKVMQAMLIAQIVVGAFQHGMAVAELRTPLMLLAAVALAGVVQLAEQFEVTDGEGRLVTVLALLRRLRRADARLVHAHSPRLRRLSARCCSARG
mgnify:CR=1 FL=1